MRQMQAAVAKAADEEGDAIQRIARGIRAYLKFFEDHPEHVELLIQERANFKSRSRPTYFEYRDANRQKWRHVHEGLIADGRFRSDISVERIMDAIGNLLYGTMFTNHFVGRGVSPDEQSQCLLEILFGRTAERRQPEPAGRRHHAGRRRRQYRLTPVTATTASSSVDGSGTGELIDRNELSQAGPQLMLWIVAPPNQETGNEASITACCVVNELRV